MRFLFTLLSFVICGGVSAQDKVDNDLLMGYLQNQEFEQVIRYMEKTVQPKHPNGLVILANAYFQNAQPAEAAHYYKRILDIDSNHITANQQLGAMAAQQQQYTQAIPHFQRLTGLRPNSAACWKQLARAASNVVGLQDSASVYMERAYAINPLDPGTVTFIADEYMGKKEFGKADSLLKKYHLTDSMNVNINAMLVKTSFNLDNFDDAVRFGRQIMESRAMAPLAYIYLSATYYNMKQYDSCIRVHDFFAELVGDAPETMKFYAAMSYGELKQYEKSNSLLLECINMAKSKSLDSYYAAIAGNYEKMKNYRAAISYYDTAYYLFKQPMRQYGIARIYDQQLQDPQKAKRHYQLYLKSAKPETKNETDIHTYVKERVKTLQ
ncbi:tetratricopeptide repeat protein [Chitinophaga sp. NPDC101104]|uniref:tetratricopeptide repeat protein n=1 Tax=Chitinophaga sp. NPDC101104 TaxID=3390561 RepID=UPI003D029D37